MLVSLRYQSDRMRPEISIIVPAFDEEARLGGSLNSILGYVEKESLDAEIIVVDDGSRDRTAEIATNILLESGVKRSKVIRYELNRGKGYAVRTGLQSAAADIAIFSDADLSTPIEEMHKLVRPIAAGEFDIAFGSRALDRSLIGTHQPWRQGIQPCCQTDDRDAVLGYAVRIQGIQPREIQAVAGCDGDRPLRFRR